MSKHFLRAYCDQENIRASETGEPIRFVISTEGVKRDGKNLKADQWVFENYRKNPVVLWAHDYFGHNLPIGRGAPGQNGAITFADVVFDPDDEFAQKVERKYRNGYLNTVSVGWEEIEIDGAVRLDLIDISGVPVPGDPDALIERQLRALEPYRSQNDDDGIRAFVEQKIKDGQWFEYAAIAREISKAIPPHSTEMSDGLEPWDAVAEVAKASGRAELAMMNTWVNPELDPDDDQSYDMPHHRQSGEVVWVGVAASMGRLFQFTTGIPEADRRGVYNHLARHYEQFGKTPPEYRTAMELEALEAEDIRGLFLEGELTSNIIDREREIAAAMMINQKLRKIGVK